MAGEASSASSETVPRGLARSTGLMFRTGARLSEHIDGPTLAALAAPVLAFLATVWIVWPALLPGLAYWDTAEFQTVGPVLGTAHPTGFPAYVILGWLASIVLQPLGEPAFRMNVLSALLAGVAAAGTAAIIQILTGRRAIALAGALLMLVMPWQGPLQAATPQGLQPSPLLFRLATHADPHVFHLALVAILFSLLLVWERRIDSSDDETRRHADRWLVAAAFVYGLALANHGLTVLLPPAIGLFILMVDWRVLLRWRTILNCLAVLLVTVVALYLELPIRAAMGAPLVYGHPDTLSGFQFVVMAKQFGVSNPFGDVGDKLSQSIALLTGYLGPLTLFAGVGFVTSLVERPRYLVLSGLATAVTCVFAASYANADLERYYLVPVMVVFTWAAVGIADLVRLGGWLLTELLDRLGLATFAGDEVEDEDVERTAEPAGSAEDSRRTEPAPSVEPNLPASQGRFGALMARRFRLEVALELAVAVVLIVALATIVPQRQAVQSDLNPGGVSEANQTGSATWMRQVLAAPDQGGLARNAVIESQWADSTILWYGQKVLGLRPDILIIDDSTRKNDRIGGDGMVYNVIDTYLGQRPVYVDRQGGSCDGTEVLGRAYQLESSGLRGIARVASRVEPAVQLPQCDPWWQ